MDVVFYRRVKFVSGQYPRRNSVYRAEAEEHIVEEGMERSVKGISFGGMRQREIS